MSRRWIAGILAPIVITAWPSVVQSHPHVWVTVQSEILYDAQKRITGIRHHWTFDEFFSAFATQGLDQNGNGKLDPAELAPLADENISSLHEFDYFTFPASEDSAVEFTDPLKDYFLKFEGGLLTLHFTLPLKKPVDGHNAKLRYSVYDPTIYVDFAYAKSAPIRLAKQAPPSCAATLAEPVKSTGETALSEAFFQGLGNANDYGKQFARDVVITCQDR